MGGGRGRTVVNGEQPTLPGRRRIYGPAIGAEFENRNSERSLNLVKARPIFGASEEAGPSPRERTREREQADPDDADSPTPISSTARSHLTSPSLASSVVPVMPSATNGHASSNGTSKPASFPTIASIESFVPSAKGSGGDYVSPASCVG